MRVVSTLADLDELILKCRSAAGKAYIVEAVACYRAGANRSAIIATWIAVLFDFLEKLKELEMSGDANARVKLADFETSRQNNNWKVSLEFERTVVHLAQVEFELISPIEAIDLDRLLEDRNRCAHPSMSSPDEPYRPTGELARNHIRNAVNYLLSHPPVQGKAALDRIEKDVESEYFPTDSEKAAEFFKTGPLAKAREALARNLIVVLSKTSLQRASDATPRARRFAALNAVRDMYVDWSEEALVGVLPGLIGAVPDEYWYRVLFFLANVIGSWELAGNAAQLKAREYAEKAPADQLYRILPYAVRIPPLREIAMKRLPEATPQTFARVVRENPSSEIIDLAISQLERASSFRGSESFMELVVLPVAGPLKTAHVKRVCAAFVKNSQLTYAAKMPGLMLRLLQETPALTTDTESAWEMVYDKLSSEFDLTVWGAELAKELKKKYGFDLH